MTSRTSDQRPAHQSDRGMARGRGEREPAQLVHASWGRTPTCSLGGRQLFHVSLVLATYCGRLTFGLGVLELVGQG
jgi:hypothetical protein